MKARTPNRTWLIFFGIVLLAANASAQLQAGENTTLNLNGTASLGWTRTQDGVDADSLTYGFNGTLTGDYYDPRFLNFTVNPYLNQSRLNSYYNSTSSASGVNAIANFLSSSRTPMQFNYSRGHNSEGTFNVPGSVANAESVGDNQTFGASAAYLPEDWPSLHGTFSHSGSSYEIIGVPGTGTSRTNAFGLSSAYELWGTHLSGGYSKSYVNAETPLFGEPGQFLSQDTNQGALRFAASRRLFDFANFSTSFSRSRLNSEYQGFRTDATYDTVGAGVGMKPTQKLGVNFHLNYSSNLNAQFLANVLGGNGGAATAQAETQTLSFTSNYLTYGTSASYSARRDLIVTGSINHQVQGQPGLPDFTSTDMNIGTRWSHQVLHGTLGAHYDISYSMTPGLRFANNPTGTPDTSFVGQNTGVSYSRQLLGWNASGSFSYARSLTTVLVGYVQSNYATNGSVSHNLHNWNFAVSGAYSQAHVESVSLSDSTSTNGSVSLSHRNLGFSGNYSHNTGSALQVGNNIVPVPGPPISNFLLRFDGDAYGVAVSYRPMRRWSITGSYNRIRYGSMNFGGNGVNSENSSEQFFVRSEYSFRQMHMFAGYSHLSQGFGIGSVVPATIDTVYFGVSRRFDIF